MKDLLFIALVFGNANMWAFKKTIGYSGTPWTILLWVKNDVLKFSAEVSCEYIELVDQISEMEWDDWFITSEFDLKQILIEWLQMANEDIKAFRETEGWKLMKELQAALSSGWAESELNLESLLEWQVDNNLPVIDVRENVQANTTEPTTCSTTTAATTAKKPAKKWTTTKKRK